MHCLVTYGTINLAHQEKIARAQLWIKMEQASWCIEKKLRAHNLDTDGASSLAHQAKIARALPSSGKRWYKQFVKIQNSNN